MRYIQNLFECTMNKIEWSMNKIKKKIYLKINQSWILSETILHEKTSTMKTSDFVLDGLYVSDVNGVVCVPNSTQCCNTPASNALPNNIRCSILR